jgi:hypothetical protein
MPKISELPYATALNAVDFIALVDRSGISITKKATATVFSNGVLTLAKGIKSDIAAAPGSMPVTNIVLVTQQQYDAIVSPDSQTLYVITDS